MEQIQKPCPALERRLMDMEANLVRVIQAVVLICFSGRRENGGYFGDRRLFVAGLRGFHFTRTEAARTDGLPTVMLNV
ncbi:hypothetical protein ZHAS_00010869 [Anopheles sinensis]|uniref:Uncharacterized protein n=1 Tax=Anopheles sinensis TaxID=74873 RepID=A0A084VYE8_ANOSI|nr:hypothetical protein ZHAS_00010869 [Anopheles sinensis]